MPNTSGLGGGMPVSVLEQDESHAFKPDGVSTLLGGGGVKGGVPVIGCFPSVCSA